MLEKLSEPELKIIGSNAVVNANSYEITWAAALKLPNNAYFELLDHPEKIIVYTFNEDKAKITRTCELMSHKTLIKVKGITLHELKLSVKHKTGDKKKITLLTLLGFTYSFNINFKPSAIDCNKPHKPITFGPTRRCIDAKSFRSKRTKNATVSNTGT